MTHLQSLRAACDAALAGGLPAGLKAAVDAALAAGATRRAVMARVRRLTGGPRAARGGLTHLAVAAYLRGRKAEGG
jgi:hypothetical protein